MTNLSIERTIPPDEKACLPNEITDRFAAVCDLIGQTWRSLGYIVDEYVSELPQGKHMQAYELFADLYYQRTGEHISPVTIRHWRRSVTKFSKLELQRYENLSQAQLTEAVKLAEINKIEPVDVCEWAVANAIDSVPAMRAHWLPQTSTDYVIDPPWISGIKSTINKWFPADDPEYRDIMRMVEEIARRLLARMNASRPG